MQSGNFCTTLGTQLNVMWQPGWEGVLGGMYTYISTEESLHPYFHELGIKLQS